MDNIFAYMKYLINFVILLVSFIVCCFFMYGSHSIKKINWDIYKIKKEDLNPEKFLFSEINMNSINGNQNRNKVNQNIKIIGIDFGSSFSGYSYTLINDISKINSNKKFPSDIILSREYQNGLIYSKSASVTMMNYNQKELKKILYISSIKTIIESKNETINDNLCYYYPNDINLNITKDISSYFTMLKNNIMKEIQESNDQEILWVIAIPSNWDEFQKQIMVKALKDSDINNIKLIYESDAASLSVYNDKYIDNGYKKKDNAFLLIDLGASSATFSVNKFEDKKGKIKNLFTSVINNIGTNYIIGEILNIFGNLLEKYSFGEYSLDNIKSNNPGNWIKFLKDINKAIEDTYNLNGIEIFEITNIFGIKDDMYFDYDDARYNIKFNNFYIIIPSNLIGKIISKSIDKIKSSIEQIISELKENKIKLNYFILTGGFSQNKIIKEEIDKYAKEKSLSVQAFSSYQYAISKGCVIYGINPEYLSPKKCPINLGIYNFINNEMEILIEKGEEIKNEIIIVKYIKPQFENQKVIQIFVYLTNNEIKDAKDLKNYLFGRVLIKMNKYYENIKLTIKYDTHVIFSAFDCMKEEYINTEFQFFNNDQIKLFTN